MASNLLAGSNNFAHKVNDGSQAILSAVMELFIRIPQLTLQQLKVSEDVSTWKLLTETMMTLSAEYELRFTAMVRRQEKIIFSVCFFYASATTPFDDLRQEVLISLFKSYGSFSGASSESTWVYKVSINTCLLALRRFTPKVKTVSYDEIFPAPELTDGSDDALRLRLEWLHAAIADLTPLDKAIIVMWLDDHSYEEIASGIGIPRNTVASRIHRIKDKLKSKKEL